MSATEIYETSTTRLGGLPELGSCALVQDLLPLYIEGEVSSGSRDIIVEHLGRCERCAGYLAGAQSVRAQMRRDQAQRASAQLAGQPERRTVRRWREALAGGLAMLLCLPGGLAAAGISDGLFFGGGDSLIVGMLMAMMVAAGLLGLARIIGPLTSARASNILGGIALGGAGVMLLFLFSRDGSPLGIVAGFAVGVAGLVGVWSGVAREGRWPLAQLL